MNLKFNKAASSSSKILVRRTLYTPAVHHELSVWLSIPRTTENHHYYLTPGSPNTVWIRKGKFTPKIACAYYMVISNFTNP